MDDRSPLPLSRLSHAGYCLRRAALLTNEQLWNENAETAKGREEHRRVHTNRIERRGDSLNLYEYDVFSEELNLRGKCDQIEAVQDEGGCLIPAAPFPVRLFPVEYKHGKLRDEEEYEIQLCAQAMCLEEMYHTHIPEGAIFYISSHRRKTIVFTDELRELVKQTIQALDEIRKSFVIPPPVPGSKCKRCSLRELCMPDIQPSALGYCTKLALEAIEDDPI